MSAVSYLNKKEAKRELKVNLNNEFLSFCSEPKNLGVTLDRSLTYRRHLKSLRKKLTSHVALLRRLAGSGWGAGATTLRTATLVLVHSTAEYCALVWCLCAQTHLIDSVINDASRIVTGYRRPTPPDNLRILANPRDTHLYLVAQQLISSSDNEINSSAAQDSCQKLFKRETLRLCRGAWHLKM